jgi:alcohol dehydrogenase
MSPFDFMQRTRVVFGSGVLSQLGELCRETGGSRVLLVTDPGIRSAGHVEIAERILTSKGIRIWIFDDVSENPTTDDVHRCAEFARSISPDLLIGFGGGSSMDTAKGANFVLTNGGRMHDYRGVGKATKPMLPMIAVPTTSGTGSEAQSFAVIADSATNMKMACGDVKAACRIALLDPELTVTMPRSVTASSGVDAMTHALESYVTTRRNAISQMFARQAWGMLATAFPIVLQKPDDVGARGQMLLGSFLAGAAIENSMLGAAHATANPLTAHFHLVHGIAVGLMMPHVIRWNSSSVGRMYQDLLAEAGWSVSDTEPDIVAEQLADRFSDLLDLAQIPRTISAATNGEADEQALAKLADEAAQQWTGAFNPRKMDVHSFRELYGRAL